MSKDERLCSIGLRSGLCCCVLRPDADAQTTADLFDDQVLHEVRLLINSRDLSSCAPATRRTSTSRRT